MKNTAFINIYGSPGSGKSTFSTYIFSRMKSLGIDCEYVPEFAKQMIWSGNKELFEKPENQFYICANQFYALNCLKWKVDVVITDSPIFLSCIYNRSTFLDEKYDHVVNQLDDSLGVWKLNFLINRNDKIPYNQNGRNETESESLEIHERIKKLLNNYHVQFTEIVSDSGKYESYFEICKQWLEKNMKKE